MSRLAGLVKAECRSCRRPVVWTTNVITGRRMPVDAEPLVGGNVVLITGNQDPEARVLKRDEQSVREARGEELYVSHFSTCPQAKEWRRK